MENSHQRSVSDTDNHEVGVSDIVSERCGPETVADPDMLSVATAERLAEWEVLLEPDALCVTPLETLEESDGLSVTIAERLAESDVVTR